MSIKNICINAKKAADELANASTTIKNNALLAMAEQLQKQSNEIVSINLDEIKTAKDKNQTAAFIDRMSLNQAGMESMINGIKAIAELPDPVGRKLKDWTVQSGLHISKVAVPLGVIGVIYESRPNVTADAAALCLKSGNAVILRGGSECANTNKLITHCLQQGLKEVGINSDAIQYMPTQDHAAVNELLSMDDYIDVIIPRGGKSLIQLIREKSRIPVFSHLDGLCHTYIHKDADKQMAIEIINNAKMRRPGICGATETLLIDQAVAADFLPDIISDLIEKDCEIRGDIATQEIDARAKLATEQDWQTEYLDAILSIKVVENINAAIAHIKQYGSGHTDAIITNNGEAAAQFLNTINSAITMHNCSTQFADGGEFGMGAEIGIATGKLHARGPVGLEQLTTFKYVVEGAGQVRA